MTKGKVVLVPFPFDDLSAIKVRPAVCLTDPIGTYRQVVLAFITSKVVTPTDFDLVLNTHDTDFTTTGLRVSSTLRLHRLVTVSTSIISRELGVLPPRLQGEVNVRLRALFGL